MPLSQQTSIKTLKMILNFGSAVLYYRLETSKNPDAKIKNFRHTHVLVQLHVTIFKKNSGMFTYSDPHETKWKLLYILVRSAL